jgi:RNA polymerase sigma-70 factor (ECF subfamily)
MTHMDPPSLEASARQAREAELDLVARMRGGDAAAFDVIHAEFNGRLFNFLARLSRRREVAEDLLDETWLRFVDRASRLDPDTRLGPFLFTVARNLYVSYCRSRMLEDSQTADSIGLWPLGTPPPSPFESTVANETRQRLDAAIAELPAAHREALLLVAVEGLKPADAAAVCGITPEAMRQRLSRARASIAKYMDEGEDPVLATLKAVTT